MKTSRSLWQYDRDEPFINNNKAIIDVLDDPSDSDDAAFKSKQKATGHTGNDGTKNVKIMVPLTLKTLGKLLRCQINITKITRSFLIY